MALYSAFEAPDAPDDPAKRAERVVLVKDGISWPALLVPVLWLLYHRMWLELALFVVLLIALDGALAITGLAESLQIWPVIGLQVLFGLEANGLRRDALRRKGYRPVGMTMGRSREEAEFRFFQSWPQARRGDGSSGPVASAGDEGSKPAATASAQRSVDLGAQSGEIIGSFPRP